ncbi:hypothetical protein LTSEBAI_4002, partial [Salmonella enterica subsp. enterica serovar Baildon str. R6-199]
MTFHNLTCAIRHAKLTKKLLSRQPARGGHEIGIAAPGINVQPAAA